MKDKDAKLLEEAYQGIYSEPQTIYQKIDDIKDAVQTNFFITGAAQDIYKKLRKLQLDIIHMKDDIKTAPFPKDEEMYRTILTNIANELAT